MRFNTKFILPLLLAPLVAACSTTRRITNSPATALQQVLETEAVDRAVHKLAWADFNGRTVYVQAVSPAEEGDLDYLRQMVSAELADHGAIITEDYSKMDYLVTAMAGAIGTDQKEVFFGIPQVQSVIVPISLPEIALYKSEEQEGFAKIELVATDAHRGGVFYRSGPQQGRTFAHSRKVLFIGWYRSDTSRYQ